MATDVNLTSQEWCDIVFEEKNKAYGAYVIRMDSSRRHIMSLIAVFLLAIFIALLPTLIDTVKKATATPQEGLVKDTKLSTIEDQKLEEQDMLRDMTPPPPPVEATLQFTPPVITAHEDIDDDQTMQAQTTMNQTQTTVGDQNREGITNTKIGDEEIPADAGIVAKPEPIHTAVEVMPSFPGGEEEMLAFIRKSIVYPKVAKENGIEGKVYIQFVVSAKGTISDVVVKKNPNQFLSDEAVRVVKMMPPWIPGKQNGKSVPTYFMIPIDFRLQ